MTLDEAISFFEAIPEEKWCVGKYKDGDKCCVLGHLGMRAGRLPDKAIKFLFMLAIRFNPSGPVVDLIANINDGTVELACCMDAKGPKGRILAFLKEIKNATA